MSLTLWYAVSMTSQITTVSTKGQFVIPSEMRSALGIKAGTRIAVTYDGAKITLQPVTDELVDKTCGMLKGKASQAEKLRRKWRQEDRW
jgi:AbrB family looped-hinge helix DNA binding protein